MVARRSEASGGGLCAVQCKNYAEGSNIRTSDIDSFLATSSGAAFDERMMVVTSDLSKTGRKKAEMARPACEIARSDDLERWPVPWNRLTGRPIAASDRGPAVTDATLWDYPKKEAPKHEMPTTDLCVADQIRVL